LAESIGQVVLFTKEVVERYRQSRKELIVEFVAEKHLKNK
jgi:hypothetical protein